MLVISRDGKTTVLTGWKAWLFWAGLCVAAAVFVVVAAALVLGFALTLAAFLLFVVPLAIALGVISTWLRQLR